MKGSGVTAENCVVCGTEFHLWAIARICPQCIKYLPSFENALRLQPTDAMVEAITAAHVERALKPDASQDTDPDILAIPRTVVAAGAVVTISVRPDQPVKPRFLRVTEGSRMFALEGVAVGNKQQLPPISTPTEFFDVKSLRMPLSIDTIQIAMDLTMTVRNMTAAAAAFEALWEVERVKV